MGKRPKMSTIDSICPLTDRQHVTYPVDGSPLRQCEACQDLFNVSGQQEDTPSDAQNRPESVSQAEPAPTPLGAVRVDPGADVAVVELTTEGLRTLANQVISEMAKTQLGTDLPHMIAFTMVGVAYLRHMGMGHNEIMQAVSVAYNGPITGVFVIDFEPQGESGNPPE